MKRKTAKLIKAKRANEWLTVLVKKFMRSSCSQLFLEFPFLREGKLTCNKFHPLEVFRTEIKVGKFHLENSWSAVKREALKQTSSFFRFLNYRLFSATNIYSWSACSLFSGRLIFPEFFTIAISEPPWSLWLSLISPFIFTDEKFLEPRWNPINLHKIIFFFSLNM